MIKSSETTRGSQVQSRKKKTEHSAIEPSITVLRIDSGSTSL
jgi:hypothetical protein